MRLLLASFVALLLPAVATANPSDPWTQPGYEYRVKLPIEGALLQASVNDLVLMVRLDGSWFPHDTYGSMGDDTIVAGPTGQVFPHEVELWDQGGESILWVYQDHVQDNNGEYLWLYYRNPSASFPNDPWQVWDSTDWFSIYHFANSVFYDEYEDVGNWGNPFNPGSSQEPSFGYPGPLGDGVYLDPNSRLDAQNDWPWMSTEFTISAWMEPSGDTFENQCRYAPGLAGRDGGGGGAARVGCVDDTGRVGMWIAGNLVETPFDVVGELHHYTFVWRPSGELELFMDGQQIDGDCCENSSWGGSFDQLHINNNAGHLGFVDEFRQTPYDFSHEEIWANYLSESGQLVQPCPASERYDWFLDLDGDGFGDDSTYEHSCNQPRDGVMVGGDCDDSDDEVNDGAAELCGDGKDNDCDGLIDGNDPDTPQNQYWADNDGDTYGDPNNDTYDCQQPSGYVSNSGDCDDGDNGVNPGQSEICDGSNVDEDCNSLADVADPAMPKIDYWRDLDSDGFGLGGAIQHCDTSPPSGYADNQLDCDDTDTNINPSMPEICDGGTDEDCDGDIDADDDDLPTNTYYLDSDADGHGDPALSVTDCMQPTGYVSSSDDCDPSNGNVFPGAPEICNATDDDCDGLVDTDDPDVDETQLGTFYRDADSDGLGDNSDTTESCDQPTGYVAVGGDCNDGDNSVGAAPTWYADTDGDNYGNPGNSQVACTRPSGFLADNTDCDDSDAQEKPGAKWYRDSDGDLFGDTTDTLTQCNRPTGYISTLGDCNDSDAAQNPNTHWLADGDGDGYGLDGSDVVQCPQPTGHVIPGGDCDDTDPALNPDTSWFRDGDADGFGDPTIELVQCDEPTGYVLNPWDCDDSDASVLPDAWWYPDTDGDGYGDMDAGIQACDPPAGHVSDGSDCDDTRGSVNPTTTWYEDNDGDGFGSTAPWPSPQCDQPTGYVLTSSDCDDTDDTVNPNTVWYLDLDSDGFGNPDESIAQCQPITGYVTNGWDCNDGDATIVPDTLWYFDFDGDGFGDDNSAIQACAPVQGYSESGGDCDDTDPFAFPGAGDICGDGRDTDCDGSGGPDDDEDGDTLTWNQEWGFSDPCDADTDGDTIPDGDEFGLDTDGDGQRDIQDTDDDGDGVPTSQEAGLDTDGDTIPDYLDTDDDGDGVSTLDEDVDGDGNPVNDDPDGDGIPAFLDFDEPNIPDTDTDGDGITDYQELDLGSSPTLADTDGDGVDDGVELGDLGNPTDSDGDGIIDVLDTDDDGDGIPSAEEGTGDTDGDGIPDRLDLDSDGDGANDSVDPDPTNPGGDGGPAPTPSTEVNYGFGCSTAGGPAGWLALGLGAMLVRRRRR